MPSVWSDLSWAGWRSDFSEGWPWLRKREASVLVTMTRQRRRTNYGVFAVMPATRMVCPPTARSKLTIVAVERCYASSGDFRAQPPVRSLASPLGHRARYHLGLIWGPASGLLTESASQTLSEAVVGSHLSRAPLAVAEARRWRRRV